MLARTLFRSPATRIHIPIPTVNRSTSRLTTSISSTLAPNRFYSTPMAAPTDTAATAAPEGPATPDSLTSTLKSTQTLQPVIHVDIQDISGGCGQSFAAMIVSDAFQGKSALQRHRLVNAALKEEIKGIHAWTPRCLTGEQWEKEKEKGK